MFASPPPKYPLDEIFNPQTAHPDEAHSIVMHLIPPHTCVLESGCTVTWINPADVLAPAQANAPYEGLLYVVAAR